MTGKQKRYLRALAHPLKPVMNLGKQGLSWKTRREIEAQVLKHELIKIRVLDVCPLTKKECADELFRAKGLELVQVIGKTLVLYCPHPDKPEIALPAT